MPKVQMWGFQCERCGHQWLPRDLEQQPRTCPTCKSPYWDRPRKSDVKPEHSITCAWQAHELDGKSVEYSLIKNGQRTTHFGLLYASDLGDGRLKISVADARDQKKKANLTQSDADSIKTHSGQFRFKCAINQ